MNRISFIDNLYVTEDVKDIKKAMRKLKTGSGSLSLYVIALHEGDDQLEYFHNSLLRQKALHGRGMTVVGLSESESGCVELVEQILNDTINATGGYDMKSYLIGRMSTG